MFQLETNYFKTKITVHMSHDKKNISFLISDILNKPQAPEESVKIQKHFCCLKDTQNDTEHITTSKQHKKSQH